MQVFNIFHVRVHPDFTSSSLAGITCQKSGGHPSLSCVLLNTFITRRSSPSIPKGATGIYRVDCPTSPPQFEEGEITIEPSGVPLHVSESWVVHGTVVETSIDAKDAVKHVGEVAWIMGQIVEVYDFPDGSLNLDIGGKYPNQIFSIYVSSSLVLGTTMDWKRRRGDWVSVRGKVEMDNGKPEIKAQNIGQMSFVRY